MTLNVRKLTAGCKVRLRCDVHTRGKRVFRQGLVMTVIGTSGNIFLRVYVRTRAMHLQLQKKTAHYYLELVSTPPKPEEGDEHHAEEGPPEGDRTEAV